MHILKCKSCNSYGLVKECSCGGTRVNPKPPRYSVQDKYGKYRREFKNSAVDDDDGLEDNDSQENKD